MAAVVWLRPAAGSSSTEVASGAPAQERHAAQPAMPRDAAAVAASARASAPVMAEAPAASRPAEGTPPGVTPDQWQALQRDMAQRPDGPAELRRLADYFSYQDAVRRFRALRASQPEAPALAALAREIQQGLPVHLQRNELSAPEAQLIEIATLQVLQPDDAARQQALAAWRQQVLQQSGAEAAKFAAANAGFEREQARIVAAWQALPAAQRDPAVLQQQLQALRERSFPSP
jgi:hypothetical protein